MRRFGLRRDGPVVLSLNVQAQMRRPVRVRGTSEVLVRHLFDRMLHNEAFGEDAAARAVQLVYAIALPAVLVALFLFPAYHQPIERTPWAQTSGHLWQARAFWAQAADHLFYVTYTMVVMGLAVVFQWEMLFPDMLDMYVLTSLPLRRGHLATGRAAALGLFLGMVLLGTSGLGALFFPAVADLSTGFWRHFGAHALAVGLGGVAAALGLLTLQALLGCLPGRRVPDALSGAVRAGAVVLLLTVLFLFPLTAHWLEQLVTGGGRGMRLLPPLWFLGVYECALSGGRALPVFHELARTAWLATGALGLMTVLLYPVAHARRLRRLVEGAGLQGSGTRPVAALGRQAVHAALVRDAEERAVFHFAAQTLLRLSRLQLYLAMYAGLGLALLVSGLLAFRAEGGPMRPVVAEPGVRMAVPIVAFWAVVGLRTALGSPLGRAGSWIFRVTGTDLRWRELRGAEVLVSVVSSGLALGAVAVLCLLAPAMLGGALQIAAQVVLACGLSIVLTDVFFLPVRALPFTAVRPMATRELPLTLVRYLVVFPAFVLWVAANEPWMEGSGGRVAGVALGFAAAHGVLRRVRRWWLGREAPAEELLWTGLGLRE